MASKKPPARARKARSQRPAKAPPTETELESLVAKSIEQYPLTPVKEMEADLARRGVTIEHQFRGYTDILTGRFVSSSEIAETEAQRRIMETHQIAAETLAVIRATATKTAATPKTAAEILAQLVPPLTDSGAAVFTAIHDNGPKNGKELVNLGLPDQSTLTKTIIPELKTRHLVGNRKGVGYFSLVKNGLPQ